MLNGKGAERTRGDVPARSLPSQISSLCGRISGTQWRWVERRSSSCRGCCYASIRYGSARRQELSQMTWNELTSWAGLTLAVVFLIFAALESCMA